MGVVYQEWQLKDQSRAVFHWDLLLQADKDRLALSSKEEILRQGQVVADSRETLMFWINQVSKTENKRTERITLLCDAASRALIYDTMV